MTSLFRLNRLFIVSRISIFLAVIVSQTPLLLNPCHGAIEFKKDSVIVDDEAEELLMNWVSQLFKVAGLKNHRPKIYLIVNSEINAAATLGGVIFINTGLIARAENASQLLGVLAHEVGHIAGGHVSRSDQAFTEALMPASAALILGGALALATGNPSLLMAGIMGSGHAFDRTLLKYSRTQEVSADHAAIDYLTKLQWGTRGLCDFFKILDDRTTVYASIMSPYAMTHPLTSERIKSIEHHTRKNPHHCPPDDVERSFQRLRGKIIGFFESTGSLLLQLSSKKLTDEGQQYAKSIALYRLGRYEEALKELDDLIRKSEAGVCGCSSGAIWYYEMKGQILFDLGRLKEAITTLEVASAKRPTAKYLKVMLAHALTEDKDPASLTKAKNILIPMTQRDPDNAFAWRLLAKVHGKDGETGLTALALAEEAAQKQDGAFAKAQAQRALKLLPSDSSGAQRAKDLLRELGA